MNLTSGDMFKSFASQKFFSFNSELEIDSTSGFSKIFISGESGVIDLFSFKSGKIFDGSNRFVRSYSPSERIKVSGNFCSGDFGYYLNESPVNLNSNLCSDSLSFDALAFATTGAAIEFSANLFGEVFPDYELILPTQPRLTGLPITGFIKNTSSLPFQSFKIFSGSGFFPGFDYQLSTNFSGERMNPDESGQFVLDFSGGTPFLLDKFKQALPLSGNLYFPTTFGEINKPVNLPLKSSPDYFLKFEPDASGIIGETGVFWSFNLERQSCSGTAFEFIFEEISWADPNNSFSDSIFITTGYNIITNDYYNNNLLASGTVPYNPSSLSYSGIGNIFSAGCSGDDLFRARFEVLCSQPDGLYPNRFKYSISGIEDEFLFVGFLDG
jgi:hypothetical protein